ncbi:MAG: VOC family protein [Verrucomicrobiota bacterium]|nr:VOC family protein [Verrucomicrobiota bacterium]
MKFIQHVALNCQDRESQEKFYSTHFGARRVRVFNAGKSDEFVMLRLGESCLELFSAQPEHRTQKAGPQNVGFSHLAFEVEDIEATAKQIELTGIKHEGIIGCSSSVSALKICFFQDPEGNRIELMQGWKDDETLST